jgi:hypothetical protein
MKLSLFDSIEQIIDAYKILITNASKSINLLHRH